MIRIHETKQKEPLADVELPLVALHPKALDIIVARRSYATY